MKKKISLLSCLLLVMAALNFVWPQKVIAQPTCSCSWTGVPPNYCQIDDPSGCPQGTTPRIITCTMPGESCACTCDIPPEGSDIGGALTGLPGGSPFPSMDLNTLINVLISTFLILVVVVAFFFLIYGGYKWVTSAGDQEKLVSAQKTITAAVVGLAIALSAWAILSLLETFFGISLKTMPLPAP